MEYAHILKGHNILHFAASKKHIGLYPGPEAVVEFSQELKNYKTDKGTIRIPYGKVDTELIKRIAIWCYDTGNHAYNKEMQMEKIEEIIRNTTKKSGKGTLD